MPTTTVPQSPSSLLGHIHTEISGVLLEVDSNVDGELGVAYGRGIPTGAYGVLDRLTNGDLAAARRDFGQKSHNEHEIMWGIFADLLLGSAEADTDGNV